MLVRVTRNLRYHLMQETVKMIVRQKTISEESENLLVEVQDACSLLKKADMHFLLLRHNADMVSCRST